MKIRREKTKNLKLNLFLIPSCIILVAFFLILFTYDLAVNKYIEKITNKQMNSEFKLYDLYYDANNMKKFQEEQANKDNKGYEEEFFIKVHYAILDENYNAFIPDEKLYSEHEQDRIQVIAKYFRENQNSISENTPIVLKHHDNTYYIKSKIYHGKSDGYSISKDYSQEARDYSAIVFTDITKMLEFTELLHKTLLFIMTSAGFILIFIIFRMTKKFDNSFKKIKKYIIDVGQRKALEEPEVLEYREFSEVVKTVGKMSKMIDEAEETQKQFFQNASHELRTPLMSIQGYAEAIESGVSKDNKKSASIIVKESQKMSTLVDDILFMSKMDMEGSENKREKIDLKELLYDCSWRVKGSADKRKLTIEHHFSEENVYVFADESRLERAFLNVFSNATRYAKSKIEVSCQGNGRNIITSISDDGSGISPKDLPHIFQRFYKGEDGISGIGLSITWEVIHEHGGSVSVSSENGCTKFLIIIPRYDSQL